MGSSAKKITQRSRGARFDDRGFQNVVDDISALMQQMANIALLPATSEDESISGDWTYTGDVTIEGTLTADHGGLTGRSDDDHTQYLLADGSRNVGGDMTWTGTAGIIFGAANQNISSQAGGYIDYEANTAHRFNTGTMFIYGGNLYVGTNDDTVGSIHLRGNGTSSDQGGRAFWYKAADFDGAGAEYFKLEVDQDDWTFSDQGAIKLQYVGGNANWEFQADSVYGGAHRVYFEASGYTAGTESFRSAADGYIDYEAGTAHRFNTGDLLVGLPAVTNPNSVNKFLSLGDTDAGSVMIRLRPHSATANGADDVGVISHFHFSRQENIWWSNATYAFGVASTGGGVAYTQSNMLSNALLLVKDDGSVGISQTPTTKFNVLGTSNDTVADFNAIMIVESNTTNALHFGCTTSSPFTSYIQSGANNDPDTFQYPLALQPVGGGVGIGTTTVPHEAVGSAKLAIEGTNSSWAAGPHVQLTTDADNYPLLSLIAYQHDFAIRIMFDSYGTAAGNKSSDAGSNFQIEKQSNVLKFDAETGIAPGSNITWLTAFQIEADAEVMFAPNAAYKTYWRATTQSISSQAAGYMDYEATTAHRFNSGNVGIGPANPQNDLHIQKNEAIVGITLDSTDTGGDAWSIQTVGNAAGREGNLEFYNVDTTTWAMAMTPAGGVGIGTTTVPHGGIGAAKLAIEGTNASAAAGPHVQFTTASDDYPLMQMLNWSHDVIRWHFDSYYDGINSKSSDAGSSFRVSKESDVFTFGAAVGAAGSNIIFTTAFQIEADAEVMFSPSAARKLYFRDTNQSISSQAAGYMDYEATTQHRFNTGGIAVDNGSIISGVIDATRGSFFAYGADTGSANGGRYLAYTAKDHDTSIDAYVMQANEDDFQILADATVKMSYLGGDGVWSVPVGFKVGDGGTTDYSEFEADGTLVFKGAATVWNDLVLPLGSARVPAANAPTWASFTGNLNAYTYAVNDYQEFTTELLHGYESGSTFEFHVHGATNNNEEAAKTVKFEIEYVIADMDASDGIGDSFTGSGQTINAELTIPGGSGDLTHFYLEIGSDTTGTFAMGAVIKGRIRRIASTGTEPTADPFVLQVGVHYEIDAVGSHTETTK